MTISPKITATALNLDLTGYATNPTVDVGMITSPAGHGSVAWDRANIHLRFPLSMLAAREDTDAATPGYSGTVDIQLSPTALQQLRDACDAAIAEHFLTPLAVVDQPS